MDICFPPSIFGARCGVSALLIKFSKTIYIRVPALAKKNDSIKKLTDAFQLD